MDVTPTPGLYKAMEHLVNELIGEAPTAIETSPAAEKRRQARRLAMDVLHTIVRLSMRIGVARDRAARGMPVIEDNIRPDPVAKMSRIGGPQSSIIAGANDA